MSALKNTTNKIVGEWEDVYSVQDAERALWADEYPDFHTDTTYYQTYGGGPEGGYFVKVFVGEGDDLNCAYARVWSVTRNWSQPWSVKELKNTVLEFEPEDWKAGKTARCRTVEEISLRETRAIVDDHQLWGNAIEIVKCLRDGLDPTRDASYKDLCLGIILDNFKYIDKHLDLLPKDSCANYKKVLHSLTTEEDNEESSDSE